MKNAIVQWAVTIAGFSLLASFFGIGGAIGICMFIFVIVVSILGTRGNGGKPNSTPPHPPDDLYSDPPSSGE